VAVPRRLGVTPRRDRGDDRVRELLDERGLRVDAVDGEPVEVRPADTVRVVGENHRVRPGTVEDPERDAGVRPVGERRLSLDEDEVGVGGHRRHQVFDDAGGEVGRHPVDDRPGVSPHHDPGLTGRDPAGVQPGVPRRPVQLERRGAFSDRTVGAEREHDVGVDVVDRAVADAKRLFGRRFSHVEDPRVVSGRQARPLVVVAEKDVEPGDDVTAGPHGVFDLVDPRIRKLASGGRDADDERLGVGGDIEGGGDRLHDRDVRCAGLTEHVGRRLARGRRVDHGPGVEHLAVCDDPVRGLPARLPELALRENDRGNGRVEGVSNVHRLSHVPPCVTKPHSLS